MIPILYDSKETDFAKNGIGFLRDCISCTVTEERNGAYEAVFKYPLTGWLFSEILPDRIVKIKANETSALQLFRIYKPSKPLNGIVTYYAQHISYDLNSNCVTPFTSQNIDASTALQKILDSCCFEHNFNAMSDILTLSSFSVSTPVSARNCFGGMSGSALDKFGGEYEFDNFTVKLHKHRGADNGVTIAYGKNLTGLTFETDISSTYTSIFPYATYNDTTVTLPEKTISLDSADSFGCARCKVIDFTSHFEPETEINVEDVRKEAEKYLKNNAIDKIKTNVKVSFVSLSQSKEYEKYAVLERVKLCDTVAVHYNALGVSVKTKVIKTVYDALNERYTNIELGEAKSNFASTMSSMSTQVEDIQKEISTQKSFIDIAIDNATSLITGQKGGYLVLNPKEKPQEMLIMDTPDINTAVNVWRFNSAGIGHSSTGYNGPYTAAITMDGRIVADFITAGVLQGIKIICADGDIGSWKITNTGLESPDGTIKMISKQTDADSNAQGGKIELYRVSKTGKLDLTCVLAKGGVYLSYNDEERGYFYVDSGNTNQSYLKSDYVNTQHLTFGSYNIGLKTVTLSDGTEIKYLGV